VVPLEHDWPSTLQPPEPPALTSSHVPTVLPFGIVQTPLQHVLPE